MSYEHKFEQHMINNIKYDIDYKNEILYFQKHGTMGPLFGDFLETSKQGFFVHVGPVRPQTNNATQYTDGACIRTSASLSILKAASGKFFWVWFRSRSATFHLGRSKRQVLT